MFSQGQIYFAIFFAIAFIIALIWSYQKDFKIHKKYYKNTIIVVIAVFLVIAIFTMITFSLH
jgi:hypothetical protein